MSRSIGITVVGSLLFSAGVSPAEVREYTLGQDDNFADGVDNVYVDPDWLADIVDANPTWTVVPFDDPLGAGGEMVPFTFVFDLTGTEQITAASLSFHFKRNGGNPWNSDSIWVDDVTHGRLLTGLGWDGSSETVLSIDLASIPGTGENLLPLLEDGVLNCMVADDSVIDDATLVLEVEPRSIPTVSSWGMITLTLLTLTAGTLVLAKRQRQAAAWQAN